MPAANNKRRNLDVFASLAAGRPVHGDDGAKKVRIRQCFNGDENEGIMHKPIKSPCFDVEERKPLQSASIKERIRANKKLTAGTLKP